MHATSRVDLLKTATHLLVAIQTSICKISGKIAGLKAAQAAGFVVSTATGADYVVQVLYENHLKNEFTMLTVHRAINFWSFGWLCPELSTQSAKIAGQACDSSLSLTLPVTG